MRVSHLAILLLPLLSVTSGCATFATNLAGEFECRAKEKNASANCEPASQIDAAAIAELAQSRAATATAPSVTIGAGDIARSRERLMRIVFPGHIDESGTLHEESVVWAVADKADWSVRLRRSANDGSSSFARSVARSLKAAQAREAVQNTSSDSSPTTAVDLPPIDNPFPLASSSSLPSTAREAVAGASAPAVEGFDMSSPLPHVRTPRHPADEAAAVYPSEDAIEAAKSAKAPQ